MISDKQFWVGLAATVGIASIAAAALHLLPRLAPYWSFSLATVLLFTVLSIGAFYAGKRASGAANKHLFTSVIMGFTLLKMMLSGITIFLYHLLAEPADKIFVLPFFILYLIFTIFEAFVMIKQARNTNADQPASS